MGDDPRAGWQSELGVADVDVTMQVRDPLVYHTLGTGIYALAAVTNGASGYGPWDAYRLEPFRRTDYTVLNELQFNSLVLRMLSAEGGALEREPVELRAVPLAPDRQPQRDAWLSRLVVRSPFSRSSSQRRGIADALSLAPSDTFAYPPLVRL